MDVTFKGSVKLFLRCQIMNLKVKQFIRAEMGVGEGCPYLGGATAPLWPRGPAPKLKYQRSCLHRWEEEHMWE